MRRFVVFRDSSMAALVAGLLLVCCAGCSDAAGQDEEAIVDGETGDGETGDGVETADGDGGFSSEEDDADTHSDGDREGEGDRDAEDGAPDGDAGLADRDLDGRDGDGGSGDDVPDAADGFDAGSRDGDDADGGADSPGDPGAGPDDSDANNDIWVEIDYSSAYSPQSPDWSFSDTPGWGPAQWATEGNSWPEAWDRWNNMSVVDDPIGRALEIGPGCELQLMLGFQDLVSYDGVSVRIEGRSRDCCSRVYFDVYNPWTGLGASGELGQQWEVQSIDLDLDGCIEPGQGVQAIRVDPTSGTVALVRMRVTLHNASW